MMKNNLSKFLKTKSKVKGKKKAGANVANVVTILAIFLALTFLIIFLQTLHIQSLQGKNTALVSTYERMVEGISSLTSELGSTRKENTDLDNRNLSLKEQVEIYAANEEKYKEEIAVNNEVIAQLTEEIMELEGTISDKDDKIADYEAEIVQYQEAAAALEDPLGLASTPLTSESYLFRGTKWNLIENYTSKKSGSTYTTEQFLVSPSYYYAVYASGNVTINCYTKEYSLVKTLKEDASSGWFVTFDSNVSYVSVKYTDADTIFVSTGITVSNPSTPTKGRSFYVVSKNSPVKLSISKAVEMVANGGTVLVLPGKYNDNVSAKSKKINLLGVDKSTCILESSDMDYQNPPLEIAAGTVKNMTIRAVDNNSKKTDVVAYAIHSDYDYQAGRGLTISNCIISSDFHAGIGLGTRTGTVTISNCTVTGKNYGIFFHDSASVQYGGAQTLKITNCSIKGREGKYALAIQGMGFTETKFTLLCKNNSFSCGSTGTSNPEICLVSGANEDANYWLGYVGFKLDPASTGNNIDSLNAK